jgi:hypothetical protein
MKPRSLTIPLALTLTLTGALLADADDRRVHVGAVGGLSFTKLTFKPETLFDTSSITNGYGGGVLVLDLSAPVALEARLLWERRSVSFSGFGGTGQARVDYLGIPILVRVAAPKPGVRPFLVVGPELLLKTGARLTATAGGVKIEEEDFDSQVRAHDVALDVGAGVEIPVGRLSLGLEGLYSRGLRNVAVATEESNVDVAKTRAFRLTIGIRF